MGRTVAVALICFEGYALSRGLYRCTCIAMYHTIYQLNRRLYIRCIRTTSREQMYQSTAEQSERIRTKRVPKMNTLESVRLYSYQTSIEEVDVKIWPLVCIPRDSSGMLILVHICTEKTLLIRAQRCLQ